MSTGRERDARDALGVEEVRREQVALEVLVLDGDAGDVGRAVQPAVLERRLEIGQAALEERHAAVPDGVGDAGVRPVERPGAGRDGLLGLGDRAHRVLLLRYH